MRTISSKISHFPTLARLAAILSIIWTTEMLANTDGSATQNFNAAASSQDYVTVKSATTMAQGRFNVGIFVNHASNTLPYFSDENNTDANDTSQAVNDGLMTGELLATYGILSHWDVGLGVPYILAQHVRSNDFHGEFTRYGNTGIRLHSKAQLVHLSNFKLATGATIFIDRTEDNPYEGASSSPHYTLELIPEFHLGFMEVALNLGYKWHKPDDERITSTDGSAPIKPIENQSLGSIAAKLPLADKWTGLAEIYGSRSQINFSRDSKRKSTNSEGLLGVKWQLHPELIAHAGISREIQHSLSSPDLRIYGGIHWTTGKTERSYIHPQKAALPPLKPLKRQSHQSIEPKPDAIVILSDVLFKFNSAEISEKKAKKELTKVAKLFTQNRTLRKLEVDGHTCSIGTDSYNIGLSQRRALAVKAFLVKHFGLNGQRIYAKGYGERMPIATNSNPRGRKLNRRVEFKVYYNKSSQLARK